MRGHTEVVDGDQISACLWFHHRHIATLRAPHHLRHSNHRRRDGETAPVAYQILQAIPMPDLGYRTDRRAVKSPVFSEIGPPGTSRVAWLTARLPMSYSEGSY